MSRPELLAPPEIFYNDDEVRKHTSSSRIIDIQSQLTERALELLALPDDGVPRLLLDIDIAPEREVDGDLMLSDTGQGLGLRSGVLDGAISISAVQWLCNADKSSHEPRLRLNTKRRKEYLVLTCGPPSLSSVTPEGKGEDGESCSDEDSSGDEENQTVCVSDRHRPRKRQKVNKKGKGREWVLQKKEQMRRKGNTLPADTKYTARKRKDRF